MFRRTKIVATVGPACSTEQMLETLIGAGVNVFRLNFSHGNAQSHREVAVLIREAAKRLSRSVAILADLQGPKIRIARFRDGQVTLANGELFTLDASMPIDDGDVTRVGLGYKALPGECVAGDILLLNDGLIELRVNEVVGSEVRCTVVAGGVLSNNKGLNRKGGGLTAKALTEKDREDIKTAASMDVDYLALSFPRDAADVEEARSLYQQAGGLGGVVAKIERAEAVADHNNLDAIILASDGVMVARGDLAVEIGDAELVGVQKHIIWRARQLDRFVITATQMMESMINNPQPTRAEVSDVANAVLDGTDAVMLSAETATGNFPELTVRAMDRIILGAERTYQMRHVSQQEAVLPEKIDESIAAAAMFVANRLPGVRAIIAMTESGSTPRKMSRIRSGLPIFAFTPHARTQRRVAMYRGVHTVPFESEAIMPEEVTARAVAILEEMGVVENGDKVIITKGDYVSVNAGTNTMKIIEVGGVIR
ncbi:MAG: pyruvate kinase [Gammaproteobacteria bacterium]|nr:pyruvate kinase [Gammaproteobacteria bacterium]MBQ0774629.1 pyruvate kinase [Gammaproteobacteria bacterium]